MFCRFPQHFCRSLPLFPFRRFLSSSFLPFAEARDTARKLGIRSWQEWIALGSQRPSGLPYHPERSYRGEYISLADYFGYEKSTAGRVRRQATSSDLNALKVHVGDRSMTQFLEVVRSRVPHFEFLPTPRRCQVRFLFRPKDSDAGWCALHFRSTAKTYSSSTDVSFSGLGRNARTGAATVCFDLVKNRLFIIDENEVGVKCLRTGGGKYDRYIVEFDDLDDCFEQLYSRGPHSDPQEWVAPPSTNCRATLNAKVGFQLQRILYEPIGLDVSFAVSGTAAHNVVVEGLHVAHRVAVSRKQQTALGYFVHTRKIVNRCLRPLDESDDIDALVAAVPENGTGADAGIRGVFVFPRRVMAERGLFSVGHIGGVYGTIVYPPTSENPHNDLRIVRAQEWQLPYYVDLSAENEDSLRQNQERFKQILKESKEV